MRKGKVWAFLPVAVFIGLAVLFWKGLQHDPSQLPSVLINKPVPEFSLAEVQGIGVPGFGTGDLKSGKVSVVNIFASWCVPCRDEHPVLMELAKRSDIQLVGINTKDKGADAAKFIGDMGNPYALIGADENGRVAIDWGGYGVPETFIVDGTGVIRFKIVGPIQADQLSGELAQQIESAKKPLNIN